MLFQLNDDQTQLRNSLERVLAEHYSFQARRAIAATDEGWSPAMWQRLAGLGLTALPVPESEGGLGGGVADLALVMETLGRFLVLEPYLASAVLGTHAVSRGGSAAQRQALLPSVADGTRRLAWAHDEYAGRHLPLWVETQARRSGDAWTLHGRKALVLHGNESHTIIASARMAGAADAAEGVALFLVDRGAPGLGCRPFRLTDDSPAAELVFDMVPATLLGDAKGAARGARTIASIRRLGIAATCAEAVGAMQAALDLTTSYVQTRQQFGRPIGANQAVRHRAAEMLVSLEITRSAAAMAARAAAAAPAPEHEADLARAKLLAGRHGRRLCQMAVQLHGGIGMTQEYAVGHYLRKLMAIEQLFGDEHAHTRELAALLAAQDTRT